MAEISQSITFKVFCPQLEMKECNIFTSTEFVRFYYPIVWVKAKEFYKAWQKSPDTILLKDQERYKLLPVHEKLTNQGATMPAVSCDLLRDNLGRKPNIVFHDGRELATILFESGCDIYPVHCKKGVDILIECNLLADVRITK